MASLSGTQTQPLTSKTLRLERAIRRSSWVVVEIRSRPVPVSNLLSRRLLVFKVDVWEPGKVNSNSDRCQNSRRK